MEERYDAFPFFLLFFFLPAVVAVDSILEQVFLLEEVKETVFPKMCLSMFWRRF